MLTSVGCALDLSHTLYLSPNEAVRDTHIADTAEQSQQFKGTANNKKRANHLNLQVRYHRLMSRSTAGCPRN